jgi:hypothetical protein
LGECGALRIEHPTGKRTEGLVRTFTDEMLSVPILHPFNNTERHSKKRMPTIVDGGGLENVRIMCVVRNIGREGVRRVGAEEAGKTNPGLS